MRRQTMLVPVALLIATALAGGAIELLSGSTARSLVVVAFLLLCPGLGLVRLTRVRDVATQVSLGIGLSLALDLAVTGGLLYAGTWSATSAFAVLASLTAAAALVEGVRCLPPNDGRARG